MRHNESHADKLRRYAAALDWIDESFLDNFRDTGAIIKAFETMEKISDLDLILIDECAHAYRDFLSREQAAAALENGAEKYRVGARIGCYLTAAFMSEMAVES